MATVRSIASEAAVSIATVSRVLNSTGAVSDDVRHRVLQVASRLGHGGQARQATDLVALVYTGRSSLGSPYDVAVLDGMSAAADEAGFDLAILRLPIVRKAGETYAQTLRRKGIRAAVLRTNVETRNVCSELAREGFPSVVVGEYFDDDPAVSYLYSESRQSSYEAAEHLIALGHRRIAIAISHIPDRDHEDRLAGYEQAQRDHQIEPDPKLVYRVWAMRPNGAQVVRSLMSLPDRPTAIYIADPLVAVGAVNQAHEMGIRIPADLSIIGFDDSDTRENVFPKLSAVCQDGKRLGYEAMQSLTHSLSRSLTQSMIGASMTPVRKSLPTWLELHETTGQPPAERIRVLPDGTRLVTPQG